MPLAGGCASEQVRLAASCRSRNMPSPPVCLQGVPRPPDSHVRPPGLSRGRQRRLPAPTGQRHGLFRDLGSRWLLSAMSHPHHVPASELGSETHTCSLNSAQLPRRRPEGEANQVNTHGLRTCPPTAQVHRGRWVVGNSSPGGVGFPTHRSTTASSKPDLSHSS